MGFVEDCIKAELLVMDYEEYLASNEAIQFSRGGGVQEGVHGGGGQATLGADKESLSIIVLARRHLPVYWVNCAIVTITIVCALPIAVATGGDDLGVDPFKRASVWIRQIMCSFILLCSGIVVDFGDVNPEFFKSQCASCFSHSSNIDGSSYARALQSVTMPCEEGIILCPILG